MVEKSTTSGFKVFPHNHDLTGIRGLADTKKALEHNSSQQASQGGQPDISDFQASDNLYDDLNRILEKLNSVTAGLAGIKTADISQKPGLIQLSPNGGLVLNDGKVSADFSTLQEKLSKDNIKTINGESILGPGDLVVASVEQLDDLRDELTAYADGLDTDQTSNFTDLKNTLAKVQETITQTQNLVSDILHRFVQMQSTTSYRGVYDFSGGDAPSSSGGSSGGGTGMVLFRDGSSTDACQNVMLNSGESYYYKKVDRDIASCASPSAPHWFEFDFSGLNTSKVTYEVVKFYLDVEKMPGQTIPNVMKFPWDWIGGEPTLPNSYTNLVFEVFCHYKCDEWHAYARLDHAYDVNCEG